MIGRVGIPFYSLRTALLCMSLAFTALTACGDDNTETNLCKDVTCEGGVCEKATGQCINPTDCAGNDDLCLEGFTCNVSTCEAVIACDNACERGVCANGACINPVGCTTNANCLGDFYCGADNTCAADPCADTTCAAGICQIGTGECVNADICTEATEATDCLSGSKCVSGQCATEAAFCADLDCQRGVCSFADLACTNSDNCGGDDTQCLAGNYCADDNTCKANVCDALNQTCARGECDPASGQCVNPDTCTNADSCVDAFVCVGGSCVATDDACGAGGCAGNQVCTYDDAASTATCGENPTGCTSALDCSTDRICDGGVCAAPSACVNDAFEPNNAVGEETDYAAANGGLPIELALCGTDVDRISFITTDDADLTGTLVAEVNILAADVGLGVLALDLLNESGTSVGTARTELNGAPTGTARVEFAITAINGGTYTLVVSDGGDVSTAGVRYSARMDVVDAGVIAACAAPETLTIGTPVAGTTEGGTTALVSSCGDADGLNGEAVYSFTIDRAVFATFVASPLTATADLAVNVRSVCEQGDSELGCADSAGANRNESLELALEAGTYVVVVEAASATAGGQFALSVAVQDVICSAADNTCLDADNANVCNDQGTAFDPQACADGCDQAAGVCSRKPGDVCANPIVVDPALGYSGTVAWNTYLGDYDPGSPSCVPGNTTNVTDGPDVVFSVNVPNNSVLTAFVEQVGSNYISAYVVEDCADLANTCIVGSNASGSGDENIFWLNDTGADKTIFLIADSEIWSSYGVSPIEIAVKPFVCTPGESRCVLNRESQICNDSGTGYDETRICDTGCDVATGRCLVTNDVCTGASPLTSGVAVSGTTVGYVDNYLSPGAGDCSAIQFDDYSGNSDAVFSFTTTVPNEIVTITVNNVSGFDPIVWVTETCNLDETVSECIAAVDSTESDGGTEVLKRLFPTPGTYFVIVEDGDSGNSTGTFDITALLEPPACTPNTVVGCSSDGLNVETCSAIGEIETYTCGGGCLIGTNGLPECGTQLGETCFDAKLVNVAQLASGSTGTVTGGFAGTADITVGPGRVGYCHFDDFDITDGNDTVFRFSLNAGQLLKLDLLSSRTTSQMYILKDCQDANTCYGYFNSEGSTSSIEYLASAPEDIFVVVDSTSTTTNTDQFSITYTVTTGAICAPNTTRCDTPNSVEMCNSDGSMATSYPCPGACVNGACNIDPVTTDACGTAPDIGAGGNFYFDSSLAFTNTVGDACDDFTSGIEAFYQVTVPAGSTFEARLSSYGNETPALYVTEDCADVSNTCVGYDEGTSTEKYSADLRGATTTAKTYFIGIDSTSSSNDEGFYLFVDVKPAECTGSQIIGCNATNDGINYCSNGFITEGSCGAAGVCANGACTNVNNDMCLTAEVIPQAASGQIIDTWVDATNTLTLPSGVTGACNVSSSATPTGEERFFAFDLLAGQVLKATITVDPNASFFGDEVLYVMGSCLDNSSCLAYTYADGILFYQAAADERVILVVDKDTTSYDVDFTVDWEILANIACVPGASVCSDATTVASCAADGSAVTNYSCLYSCVSGACTPDPILDNACDATTPVLTGSTIIQGDFTGATNSVEIPSSTCGIGSFGSDGQDLVYLLDIPANTRIEARLTEISSSAGWQTLYLFTDCGDAATTCLAGDYASSGYATVEYQTGAVAEQIYVALDLDDPTSSTLTQRFELEYFVPDCDPATYVQACNADGTGFTYCNAGFSTTFLCGGVGTCNATSNACDEPGGDICLDPFVANPPVLGTPLTITGTLGDFSNDYDLGTGNVCTLSRTLGADAVYAVTLTAGQTLTATLVSDAIVPEDLALYVSEDCSNVRNQCLGGADNEGGTAVPEVLTYTAAADGTYFVFVDSFYAGASGDYILNVTVQ